MDGRLLVADDGNGGHAEGFAHPAPAAVDLPRATGLAAVDIEGAWEGRYREHDGSSS
jgi:hypothetical protein